MQVEEIEQETLAQRYALFINKREAGVAFDVIYKFMQFTLQEDVKMIITGNLVAGVKKVVGKGNVNQVHVEDGLMFLSHDFMVGAYSVSFVDGSEYRGNFAAVGIFAKGKRFFKLNTLTVWSKEQSHGQ